MKQLVKLVHRFTHHLRILDDCWHDGAVLASEFSTQRESNTPSAPCNFSSFQPIFAALPRAISHFAKG
jgi:hypothetical protein